MTQKMLVVHSRAVGPWKSVFPYSELPRKGSGVSLEPHCQRQNLDSSYKLLDVQNLPEHSTFLCWLSVTTVAA